jgi:hypothetical protein
MAAASKTTFSAALKESIPDKRVETVGYKDNPLLALIKKKSDMEGVYRRFVVWHGGNQGGVGATFATAQAGKSVGLQKSFNVTTVHKYGLTSIENEVILASKSNVGSFLRAAKSEDEQTIRNVSNDLGIHVYRNLGGARGRVGGTSTTTLTLLNPEDIVHFEQGMRIVSDDTDGTSGAADTEVATISAVNIDAGTIHRTDANWTTGGNYADNDYLFRAGDFGLCVSGLDSWIPAAAPGATPFFGVDRSSDPTRLGGMRHDGSAGSIEEALLDASIKLQRLGGSPDVCMMNHTDFSALRKELGTRIMYTNISSTGLVPLSFRAIELPPVGNGKPIRVISDRNCQKGVSWLLQLDTWELCSHGKMPHTLSADVMGGAQGSVIWEASADAVEVRTGYYGNLGCFAPGYNARIALPTV